MKCENKEKAPMKVIGIDPAPVKKSILFDGEEFKSLTVKELKKYLDNLGNDVLVCWDAPLMYGINDNFYSRKIEEFLRKKEAGTPNGINTLGYAGCPHWAMTQYCVGYPVVNREFINEKSFCFKLIEEGAIPQKGRYIIETHPAVSMWLLIKANLQLDSWKYKGGANKQEIHNIKENRTRMIKTLFDLEYVQKNFSSIKDEIDSDDKLDAFVAWLTGILYENNKAKILGGKKYGAMLLPYDQVLFQSFQDFI